MLILLLSNRSLKLTYPQDICNKTIQELYQKHPILAALENGPAQDGVSTGTPSMANTPRPSTAPSNGPKIKLTFGGGSSNGVTTNGIGSGAASGTD